MEAALNGPQGRISLEPGVIKLGRLSDNQIIVNDSQVSSHHAEIHSDGQTVSVIDRGSTNGTFINESRLAKNAPRNLIGGDILRFGSTVFTYEATSEAPPAPTVLADPGQVNIPGVAPTVMAAPPAYTAYAQAPEQNYAQPGPTAFQAPPPMEYQAPPPPPYQPYPPNPQQLYAAVPPTRQKINRNLLVILGVIAGVIVLACIITAVVVANLSTPEKTMTTFCDDLVNSNFHDAYGQMSAIYQSHESEAAFTTTLQTAFRQVGGLKSCVVNNVSANGNTGAAQMTWTPNLTTQQAAIFNTILVNESGTWKIDSFK